MGRAASLCLALLLSGGAAEAQVLVEVQAQAQVPVPAEDRQHALLARTAPAADRWVYSETVSPLDYAPVAIASAWSDGDPDGPALQLSIQCRRGRTDLVIASPGLAGRPEIRTGELRVLWAIDDRPPLTLATGAAPTGTGLSVKDDVVRLLGALPADGELALEVTIPQKPALHGRYAIAPLKAVLGRMAAACKWPAPRP